MVCCLFQGYRGVGSVLKRKRGFWFGSFCGDSQFGHHGKVSYYQEIVGKEAGATSNDLVDGTVVKGLAYVLRFGFLI